MPTGIFEHKPCSKETKKKISIANKGEKHYFYGKYHSKETKQKLSKARKGRCGKNSPGWRGGKIEVTCQYCGKIFKIFPSRIKISKNVYCNQECTTLARVGENNPNWNNGSSFEPYSPSFNQQQKDRVRVRDNFICQLCGVPELECDTRLCVHHIDYDKQNNDLDNLISLCNSCNSKVNFNREKWTIYFQKRIMEFHG